MKSPLTFVFGFIRECGKKLFENNKKKRDAGNVYTTHLTLLCPVPQTRQTKAL